jgi:predicted HicB family RNase H-like nuclease
MRKAMSTETMSAKRKTLEDHFATEYTFHVIADEDIGGYTVVFPDLPGCLTQFDSLDQLPHMVDDAKRTWMTSLYEAGQEIPPPTFPETYSGRFNVRLPRSLHRALAESAEREGVSLNQYVVMLLTRGDAETRMGRAARVSAEVA